MTRTFVCLISEYINIQNPSAAPWVRQEYFYANGIKWPSYISFGQELARANLKSAEDVRKYIEKIGFNRCDDAFWYCDDIVIVDCRQGKEAPIVSVMVDFDNEGNLELE